MGVPGNHDPSDLFEEGAITDGHVTISWSEVDCRESFQENADETILNLTD